MAISPTISTITTPMVSINPTLSTANSATITPPNVSYNQILNSLGTYVYGGEFIYMSGTNYVQVAQTFKYNHFDANGRSVATFLPFVVDPYQSQPAVYNETNPDEVVLDGFSALTFLLKAGNTVYFKIFTLVNANTYYLNKENKDNFEVVEASEGIDFFNDFCNYLIDEEDVKA